jgi:hypothetical protein
VAPTGYTVHANKWIGRGSNKPWPPRSPDITPLDTFFWGDGQRAYLPNTYQQ